ncbi:MAG: hypothetical protein LBI79_05150 [Nitrososphaerota archaeon]|nr:hypothetical protein [Nitrososphaerota archaeon]
MPAFKIANRISDDLTPQYQSRTAQIRASIVVNVDESGVKVDGVNYWI